jgi:hypothetical protein
VSEKKMPFLQQGGTEMSMAEWVTRLSLLGATNREAYRAVREQIWRFVVENSSRSDFPSEMS